MQPGLTEIQYAEALRHLGDLEAAQTYAEEAVNTADQCHVWGQVHRYATLAMVLAARGEVEQVPIRPCRCSTGAQGMESRRIGDRILAVSEAISRRGYSIVARDVSERVKAQFTVPV